MKRVDEAWRLRCAGWSQIQIAKELGCDQTTVSRWLKEAFDIYKLQHEAELDKHAIFALARIEKYLKALDVQIEAGDTKSIGTAIRVLERYCKLLGLDAPTKQTVEISNTQSIEDIKAKLIAKLPILEQRNGAFATPN